MKITIHLTSQGRLLEGHLFIPDSMGDLVPTLLFEGPMTGALNQVADHLAGKLAEQGFACLLIDHNYFNEIDSASQPWESPQKRQEDIKAALQFLVDHEAVDKDKIIAVGLGVGAEFLAQVCRSSKVCKGLVAIEGPFDDARSLMNDLSIPTLCVPEAPLEKVADQVGVWIRSLLSGHILSPFEGRPVEMQP